MNMNIKPGKTKAQTMVEFAIVLPLLLLLLYGVLETGRALFIYGSTITAARQAVRYGSATGTNPDNGTLYYRDCAGIRDSAKNVGFLQAYEDSDITITYDRGLNSSGVPVAISGSFPACPPSNGVIQNGDRVIVTVTTSWAPVVPLVPLGPFTFTSTSERTILVSVDVAVTAAPGNWSGSGTGVLSLAVSDGGNNTYNTLGQSMSYTYTLSNTGTGVLNGPFTVTDITGMTVNCGGALSSLQPGQSTTCSGTYTVTQTDLDTGSYTTSPSAVGSGTNTATATGLTATAVKNPAVSLLGVSASPNYAPTLGDVVTFTYSIKNIGNVTLTSPYNITNTKSPVTVSCAGAQSPLAPGETTACSGTYSITNPDLDAGSIINTSTVSAEHNGVSTSSNTSSVTVVTRPLYLTITFTPETGVSTANTVINYTYTLKNVGTDPIIGPYTFTGYKGSAPDCSSAVSPLTSGATTTCTGSYTATQADMDAGLTITNAAYASAKVGSLNIISNTYTANTSVNQNAAVSLSVSTSPALATTLGQTVTYTYTITNTGTVTLSAPFSISENRVTGITCTNPATLAPNATTTCTGTTTVAQADLDKGSFTSASQASAKFGNQTVTSTQQTANVITYAGPRFSLALSASPTTITQNATPITFTYTFTNTGGVTLTSPFTITSSYAGVGTFTCTGITSIAVGGTATCTKAITSGKVSITNNTTSATAMNASTTVNSSNLPSVSIPAYICDTDTMKLTNSSPSGDPIDWTITNTSGLTQTITSISVTWGSNGGRYLTNVFLPSPSTSIWSGSDTDGSALFSGSYSIPVGSTTLRLDFAKSSTVSDLTINFSNDSGCPVLSNP